MLRVFLALSKSNLNPEGAKGGGVTALKATIRKFLRVKYWRYQFRTYMYSTGTGTPYDIFSYSNFFRDKHLYVQLMKKLFYFAIYLNPGIDPGTSIALCFVKKYTCITSHYTVSIKGKKALNQTAQK
jgi:hypothetical protein